MGHDNIITAVPWYRESNNSKSFFVEDISPEARFKTSLFFVGREKENNGGLTLLRTFKKNPYSRKSEHDEREIIPIKDYQNKRILDCFEEHSIDFVKISRNRFEIFMSGEGDSISITDNRGENGEGMIMNLIPREMILNLLHPNLIPKGATEEEKINDMLTKLYELFTNGHFKLIKEASMEKKKKQIIHPFL